MIVRAVLPSCALTIVKVSVALPVTRTISALAVVGVAPVAQTVALKGGNGNSAPCPEPTVKLVPDVAGEGAVATAPIAKFACASGMASSPGSSQVVSSMGPWLDLRGYRSRSSDRASQPQPHGFGRGPAGARSSQTPHGQPG